MNEKPQPLRFERIRNFGAVFSDTRKFIRDNFGVYFKTILFLTGPFVIITCTLQVYYQVNLLGPDSFPQLNRIGSWIALNTIYSQLRWFLNGLITAVVVSHFIVVYREKGQGKFDTGDVSRSILKNFGSNAATFIVLLISVSVITTLIGFTIYGMTKVSILGGIFFFGIMWIVYFLIRFPFWYYVYSVFFSKNTLKTHNPFAAIGYSGKLLSGNWWSTWLIFFSMWIVLYIIGYTISMPANILAMIAQLSSIDVSGQDTTNWKIFHTIAMTIGEFAKTIVNSVFCVAIGMQFFSLKEKNDGEGMRLLIEQIGSKEQEIQHDEDGW